MSYDLATSRIPIPSELHKSYQFPYPGMPSLAQGEAIFFPVSVISTDDPVNG